MRRADKFLAPQRHPKWCEVNLAASVSSWTGFQPTQKWLDRHREQEVVAQPDLDRFFRSQSNRPAGKEEIYQAYLKWRQAR
jgi:hypothetical protein